MSKARLVIIAVIIEGRSQSDDVARAQQRRELLGTVAPSDLDRDHFIDFFTAFIPASVHIPAALDQLAAGSPSSAD